jgi:hypothetical protein
MACSSAPASPANDRYDDDDLLSDGGLDAADAADELLELLSKPLPIDTE